MPRRGEGQQRHAVGLCNAVFGGKHRLVAAHLHVPAHEGKGQPDQRVEPVNAKQQKGQQLHRVVAVADVEALMRQHIAQRLPLQADGQIDPGPDQPQDEGGAHRVRLVHIVRHQHGPGQALAQMQVGHGPVDQQRDHARTPQRRPDSAPDLHRVRAGRLRCGGQRVQRRLADRAHPAPHAGRGYNTDVPWKIRDGAGRSQRAPGDGGTLRGQAQDAERRVDAHRADQAKGHHAPQQIGPLLRRTPQQQTYQQHRQDHQRGGKLHVQEPQKHRFHLSAPDARR